MGKDNKKKQKGDPECSFFYWGLSVNVKKKKK